MPGVFRHGAGGGRMSTTTETPACTGVFLGLPSQVREARNFVAQAADGCPVTDDVVLLASEIATNAVVHTASGEDGTFTVVVQRDAGLIRVEVHDGGSPSSPTVRPVGDLGNSAGRGLGLVDELAARWGYLGGQDGRVVWFEMEW